MGEFCWLCWVWTSDSPCLYVPAPHRPPLHLPLVEGRGFELVSGIRLSIPDRNKRNGLFPQIERKLRISLTEKGSDILQLGKEPLLLNRRFDPHALGGQCQPEDVIGLWCPLFRLNFLSALLTSVHEAHLLKIF